MTVLLDYCDNSALRSCLRKYPGLRPADKVDRLPSLSDAEVDRILEGISTAENSQDPRTIKSYAMVALFLGCGFRTKELRFSEVADVDTEDWIVHIIHVKGEDSYGQPRAVPLAPEFRGIVSRYLATLPEGQRMLFSPGHSDEPYCSNALRTVLNVSLKEMGIRTDPRALRRTFGQRYLDAGIDSIESVSVLMGHSNTRTTEKYYARRKNTIAIEAARATWRNRVDSHITENIKSGDDGQTSENKGESAEGRHHPG